MPKRIVKNLKQKNMLHNDTPSVHQFFALRFSALSKVIFDCLPNGQFKYTVFDYLLNNPILAHYF